MAVSNHITQEFKLILFIYNLYKGTSQALSSPLKKQKQRKTKSDTPSAANIHRLTSANISSST